MSRVRIAKLWCVMVMCMGMSALVVPHVHAQSWLSCGKMGIKLAPCIEYLRKGGSVPDKCCKGMASLLSEGSNDICNCIKQVVPSGAASIYGLQSTSVAAARGSLPALIIKCSISMTKATIPDCFKEEG